MTEIHTITTTSLLVDFSKLDPRAFVEFIKRDRKLTGRNFCSRIQKVPQLVCSEHQAFLSPARTQSFERIAINKFNETHIPMGVWPPQNYITSRNVASVVSKTSFFSKSWSDTGTQSWLKYNAIAFVEYESKKAKQIDCVNCLLQHTEVFFAYNDESTTGGYIWMRPAPSTIIKSCVAYDICSSLTYNDQRNQLKRPVGLRQMTHDDINWNEKNTDDEKKYWSKPCDCYRHAEKAFEWWYAEVSNCCFVTWGPVEYEETFRSSKRHGSKK